MGSYANVALFYFGCIICYNGFVASQKLVQLTYCSASVDGKLINLEPLTDSLSAAFGDWNYTYNPCFKFSKPKNANHGFGDKCLAVAFCKFGEQSRRQYYYTLGFHNDAEFVLEKSNNETTLQLVYNGFRSMKGKTTYVRLVCDTHRTKTKDAYFTIVKDLKGLGNVYAELHHVSCCPGGQPHNDRDEKDVQQTGVVTTDHLVGIIANETDSDNEVVLENKNENTGADRTKVLIIVGVNVGVIFVASVVGFMCYNSKSHTDFYSKLPGVRNVPELPLWQLASIPDIRSASAGPIISTGQTISAIPSTVKAEYRDGAPHKRKSVTFPVLDHCEISEDSLTISQRLGGSIFWDTYVADWTGITVTVKRLTSSIHKYQINKENIGQLKNQVSFLSKQRHRNIVSVLGYCSESVYPYIISECITGQVMKDFIKNAGQQLTWPHRIKILSQVADGMAFLHSTQPPILHRDLRCGNLFITNNDVVKICDFGVVNIIQPLRSVCQLEDCCCQGLFSACPPSIAWTAPEVLEHPNAQEGEGYITTATDVYSYAVVMWELVMCEDPFEDMNTAQEVMDYVKSGGRPEVTGNVQVLKSYNMLMKKCWDSNPNDRPSFKQITVRLKEILHQAKMFQKALSNKGIRTRTSSKSLSISFSDNNEKT